ncbi:MULTISPECIES: hypothetical protein [Pseudoalteromonas]|uniref:hypothetical protein n=1 Tax=Pseudoalteromonas TaxID=53246 RepID=UPI001B36E49B|nr:MULTISPECIES: hypothetical protein [Pseudoalteromonas]MBQ4838842.1 hypothetical protein [Pseudoalteromonas luteoviolacea]MCG7548583.1 hypothetical protein [Pseudoalteromonas sp. Of7M-16]
MPVKSKLVQVTFSCNTEYNGVEYTPGDSVNVSPEMKALFEKHGFIEGDENAEN